MRAGKRSVKSLLTQDQLIPGLGNAIAQDILFHAQLHPMQEIATVHEVITQGGRYDEVDLYGSPGGYVCRMDQKSAGSPCPLCGSAIEKIQYLGGACYFCSHCQQA